MGAEEVFPDAVAILRWRDRNQRMLPKLALDGIATRDSAEQLIHCLQAGDKDAQLVVYGYGVAQPIEISPPLLSAWGGGLTGFNVGRWVHALSANAKKMMAVMENITKLVRANKFTLDTVLYKVGEDAISDAFSRAADASDSSQVVLIFPSLQEELQNSGETMQQERPIKSAAPQEVQRKKEDEEREKLKAQWLNLLFTSQSAAATSTEPAEPLPITLQSGDSRPRSLLVWLGDNATKENAILGSVAGSSPGLRILALSWAQHPDGEGLLEFDVNAPKVVDGSWYLRDKASLENEDLDMLHDVEVLGRAFVEATEQKLSDYSLTWKNVVLCGFGKGAGVALYASLLGLIPKQVAAMLFFSPIVPFPWFLSEKLGAMKRSASPLKMFTIWGSRDRSTPGSYRQLLAQALRKAPEVNCTPDTLPYGDHSFDSKSRDVLTSLLPLCLPS